MGRHTENMQQRKQHTTLEVAKARAQHRQHTGPRGDKLHCSTGAAIALGTLHALPGDYALGTALVLFSTRGRGQRVLANNAACRARERNHTQLDLAGRC